MNYLPKSLVWDITQFLTYDEMEESFSEEMDDPEFWNFKIAHEFPDQKLPEEGATAKDKYLTLRSHYLLEESERLENQPHPQLEKLEKKKKKLELKIDRLKMKLSDLQNEIIGFEDQSTELKDQARQLENYILYSTKYYTAVYPKEINPKIKPGKLIKELGLKGIKSGDLVGIKKNENDKNPRALIFFYNRFQPEISISQYPDLPQELVDIMQSRDWNLETINDLYGTKFEFSKNKNF